MFIKFIFTGRKCGKSIKLVTLLIVRLNPLNISILGERGCLAWKNYAKRY